MTDSFLVINADGPETRVALVEDGLLAELYIERKQERGIAGNIYKGRVERVLPGMQAAFVNIGLEKSAYLHVSDVRGTPDDLRRLVSAGEGQGRSAVQDDDEDSEPSGPPGGARIEDLLREGQDIVVQVTKEPISTKGARVTRYISLPGRHLVFMPTVEHVGSRGAFPRTRNGAGCARSSTRCGRRGRASSCGLSRRTCRRRISARTWISSSSCGTRSFAGRRTAGVPRSSTTISISCCVRCATCSRLR
jgi:hypothetical protein